MRCPILNGRSIADLDGGNMTGSCDPPPNGVWSTYAPLTEIPQEYTTPAWQTVAATSLTCPGAGQYAQCFSFSCVLDGTVNGQALAKCTCPIDKAPKQFVTAGGIATCRTAVRICSLECRSQPISTHVAISSPLPGTLTNTIAQHSAVVVRKFLRAHRAAGWLVRGRSPPEHSWHKIHLQHLSKNRWRCENFRSYSRPRSLFHVRTALRPAAFSH